MYLVRKSKKGKNVGKKTKAIKTEKNKDKSGKEQKKPFLSDRQKKVLLVIVIAMVFLVPVWNNLRCKAACLKKVKTPYPEIACKYECPWLWPWQQR